MAAFQPDPSSMMDMGVMNNAMYNNLNLDPFSQDVHMEMGSLRPSGFDAMDTGHQGPPENIKTDSSESINLNINGVGAGPLPTGFGVQGTTQSGSTLTEFTKRRNWSQRVLEEIKDLLYILTPDGRLLYISPSCKTLTGYEQSELKGKIISDFIHADDSALFVREFNESIATGNPIRFFYRFRNAEGKYVIFECHGHPHLTNDISHLEITGGPVNTAGFCRGFFMMARPYPTSNSQLLDSFLEHKIENVRLQARIAALQREEAEDAEKHATKYHKRAGGNNSSSPNNNNNPLNNTNDASGNGGNNSTFSRTESSDLGGGNSPSQTSRGDSSAHTTDFHNSMPPPSKPTLSNIALTREALDEANAFIRPDSIGDKMARYEGSSHVDSIEMLTGLRYREGERAQGISTGGTSPALIRGDAGIDIPADKGGNGVGGGGDPRLGGGNGAFMDKKHKKVKSADEFVCTDCGTLDSPEWRRGPNGPKTLCNACGLRWAKKEKKKGGPGGEEGGSGGNTVASNAMDM